MILYIKLILFFFENEYLFLFYYIIIKSWCLKNGYIIYINVVEMVVLFMIVFFLMVYLFIVIFFDVVWKMVRGMSEM